jgi:hypothetical protein
MSIKGLVAVLIGVIFSFLLFIPDKTLALNPDLPAIDIAGNWQFVPIITGKGQSKTVTGGTLTLSSLLVTQSVISSSEFYFSNTPGTEEIIGAAVNVPALTCDPVTPFNPYNFSNSTLSITETGTYLSSNLVNIQFTPVLSGGSVVQIVMNAGFDTDNLRNVIKGAPYPPSRFIDTLAVEGPGPDYPNLRLTLNVTAGGDFSDPNIVLHSGPCAAKLESANASPVLAPIGDKLVNEGELLQFTVSATDQNSDALTYSASNLPDGASFDPVTKTFSWVPGYNQSGYYIDVLFTVTDDQTPPGSDSETITITVGEATVITLSSFTAYPSDGEVLIEWITGTEIDNVGFNLYRSKSEVGGYVQLNSSIILAEGDSTQGAIYEYVDEDVKNRKTYYYMLEDIDLYGISTFHGPISATPRLIFGGINR